MSRHYAEKFKELSSVFYNKIYETDSWNSFYGVLLAHYKMRLMITALNTHKETILLVQAVSDAVFATYIDAKIELHDDVSFIGFRNEFLEQFRNLIHKTANDIGERCEKRTRFA